MDISIKEMRSKPVWLWKDIIFILFNNQISLKELYRPYTSRIYVPPSTETRFFLGKGGGALFEGGRLLQILTLGKGANLKLGANSSICGNLVQSGSRYWPGVPRLDYPRDPEGEDIGGFRGNLRW